MTRAFLRISALIIRWLGLALLLKCGSLSYMPAYRLVGRVHPERASVEIQVPTLGVTIPDLEWTGQVTAYVGVGQAILTFEGNDPIEDVATLKNSAQSLMQDLANVLCYKLGNAYTVEITALVADKHEHVVFGVNYPLIAESQEKRPIQDWDRLFQLALASPQLRRALGDLRRAILEPADTAFHCQRAIEAIRHQFQSPEADRATAWSHLQAALNLSEATLKTITDQARAQRHGEVVSMNEAQRDEAILLAWQVVDRFFVYKDLGETDLATDAYPLV